VLLDWLAPYVADIVPTLGRNSIQAAIVSDAIFLCGLFLLGGGFWDKLRSLFVRRAEGVFPPKGTATA
jgi:hypothetical protein